jgi:metallo-beta-lactamase family protein
MKLTFCGAARIVTGSCHLLEIGNEKHLIDCGMFQGPKEITKLNYENFLFDPKEINSVFLTHAHIDHSGLLPKLVDQGFTGRIFATPATKDLCKIMLEDSAEVQVSQNEHENRRRQEDGLPSREPLYTRIEAKDAMRLFRDVRYGEMQRISDNVSVRYQDAGHILGSAIIEVFAKEGGKEKKIVFSGDLGQWNNPIIRDPTIISEADYLLIESTYGDRLHEDVKERESLLLKYAKETYDKGGKLFIPSFAVERTQELLYTIKKLSDFPKETIFLDSPLAMRATNVFIKHPECYDEETRAASEPLRLARMKYTASVQDSKKINRYSMPCVVIAGSGMCTGGRIRHHLRNGIEDRRNTVLFVGYQAEGTLGRHILDGESVIRMMGMDFSVRMDVRKIDGFSAHADSNELVKWASGFKTNPKVFIVHGEPAAAESLKEKLDAIGLSSKVASMLETVEL